MGCAVGGTAFELSRYYDEVMGVDFSQAFVDAANFIKVRGKGPSCAHSNPRRPCALTATSARPVAEKRLCEHLHPGGGNADAREASVHSVRSSSGASTLHVRCPPASPTSTHHPPRALSPRRSSKLTRIMAVCPRVRQAYRSHHLPRTSVHCFPNTRIRASSLCGTLRARPLMARLLPACSAVAIPLCGTALLLHTESKAFSPPPRWLGTCACRQGDACSMPERFGPFDVVFCGNLLCRLPDPMLFLNRLPSILKPGGIVVLVSPYSWLEEYTPEVRFDQSQRIHHQLLGMLASQRVS